MIGLKRQLTCWFLELLGWLGLTEAWCWPILKAIVVVGGFEKYCCYCYYRYFACWRLYAEAWSEHTPLLEYRSCCSN